MEIILLWFDDLDDLVFTVIHAVERLRWPCLNLSFTAACGLVAVRLGNVLVSWIPGLVFTAASGVMFWIAALIARELSRLVADPQRTPAGPGT